MFKNTIFTYELKYWLKNPTPYLYFAVFFAIAAFSFAGSAGFFDPLPTTPQSDDFLNSPFEINKVLQYFNKFFLFLLPAIIGASVYKDYKSKVHSILYTFPIRKIDYLLGKFFSAWLIIIGITLSFALGVGLAEHLPNLNPAKVGSFNPLGYLQAYAFYTLPNMLIYGILVFIVVIWTRNIYASFVCVILLFFLQSITENAFINYPEWIALLDPFADNTTAYVTQDWIMEDRNARLIPVSGMVLYNRLLWLSISLLALFFTYLKFEFHQASMLENWKKVKEKGMTKKKLETTFGLQLPKVTYDYSIQQQIKNIWRISNFHLASIVKNPMFLLIVFLGLLAVSFILARVTNLDEMSILPATRIMLSIPAFFFNTIIMLLTFIYAGMLVHKDRNSNSHQLIDTKPTSNWTFLLSKLLAVIKMQAILLLVMLVAGIGLQVYNGYYQFELELYFFHLFTINFTVLIIWAMASIFVHAIIPNTYLGIFILLMGWIGMSNLSQLGIDTLLLMFNNPPQLQYSDLNAYGGELKSYFLVEGYWFCFGILLLIATYLLWFRGVPQTFKERLQFAKLRWSNSLAIAMSLVIILFLSLGFVIFKEEAKLPDEKVQNQAFKTFGEAFEHFGGIAQPKVTDIQLQIDLFPEQNSFEAKGTYLLINQSNKAIDTILLKTGFDEQTTFEFNQIHQTIAADQYVNFYALKLQEPLAPKDTLTFQFQMISEENTLFQRNSDVLENGTFLRYDIFPRFGYFLEKTTKHPNDSSAAKFNVQSPTADLVNFEATMSTTSDQIALAPGYLQRSWQEEDRTYFHYKMDKPMKFFFCFNSGRFEVKKEEWNGVNLEIYYHKGHERNLEKMMEGLKAAVEYNTQYFSAFQHREARIIEFPQSEGTFATITANSIPTSEIRFIANTNTNSDKIDLSFYVAAHELTHQWWGNQVIPADAFGASMLSESITEYITLQIYKRKYGEEKALQFLKAQRERYLNGRKKANSQEEPPLMLVKTPQQYISYGKGAIAFNSLSQHLGEEKFNAILQSFLKKYGSGIAPFPTSFDLVSHLKSNFPDSLQYLIEDYFEQVGFYDNKIIDAKTKPSNDGNYEVELDFFINKFSSNKKFLSRKFMEIGFYNSSDQLIDLQWYETAKMQNKTTFPLKKQPFKVVLDPNYLLLDQDVENNVFEW